MEQLPYSTLVPGEVAHRIYLTEYLTRYRLDKGWLYRLYYREEQCCILDKYRKYTYLNRMLNKFAILNFICLIKIISYYLSYKAKLRKYRGVFKLKSRGKIRQVWENLSQQLEHKQILKFATTPVVRKRTRSLLACHKHHNTPCKPRFIRWLSKSVRSLYRWWMWKTGLNNQSTHKPHKGEEPVVGRVAPLKPLVIRWRSSKVWRSWNWWKVWLFGMWL